MRHPGRVSRTSSSTPGRAGRGRAAAYGAALLALGYAAVSLYWALGGMGLLSTVGGQFVRFAERGGPAVVALGVVVIAIKVAGGVLALALVQPWGRRIPQRLLLGTALAGGVVLTLYGGVLVLVGALVLTGVVRPSGPVDETALRWHLLAWDLWFLLWGLLLGAAALQHRADHRSPAAR